jgi:phosphatidylserine/phosphatidylglycerophosphate/cardiolipin synthases and related enzymes
MEPIKDKHIIKGHDKHSALTTYLRIAIIAIAILFQLFLMGIATYFLRTKVVPIYILLDLAAMITVFGLINRHDSSTYRMAWIVLVLLVPIFGLCLYLAWGRVNFNRKEKGALNTAFSNGFQHLPANKPLLDAFSSKYPQEAPYAQALTQAQYPLYTGTSAKYFPIGESYFDRLIEDLEAAEKFIFIEYFIFGTGQLWNRVHEVLLRKLAEGVEVRLFYDDFGCFFKIPDNFHKILRSQGFQVAVFNPAHRFLSSLYLNYRNHQKIVVIDGQIGYTGGVNLADEYINVDSKLGHWKDVGIRVEGSAVRSLEAIFLQMWNIATKNAEGDYGRYFIEKPVAGAGYFQPYADGPYNNPKNPALDLIRQAVGGARKYLWFTTPYLVIDQELSASLCLAARGGVDVRIVTPHICDHWYVGLVNRHNYRFLLQNGVKIYEYTPGFIHGKLMLWDDRCGTVGSVNLDFRSLYLHYENGIFICDAPVLLDIKADFEQTMEISHLVTLEEVNSRPWYKKLMAAVLNLFSPLM